MISWNLLGILLWVIVILYLVFIIQNIRKRRITMIINQHKRFTWPNFILDIVEVLVLLLAAGYMFSRTFLDNPRSCQRFNQNFASHQTEDFCLHFL